MPDTAPFLTEAMVAELLLQLRADRVRKREFISSLTEGVVLAVEQVQEVRLASLEAGPETSGTGLVADAFWGFLFDSGINVLWSRVVLSVLESSLKKLSVGLASHAMLIAKKERQKVEPLKALRAALYQRARASSSENDGYGRAKADKPTTERLVAFLSSLDQKQFDTPDAFRRGTIDIRRLLSDEIARNTGSGEARTGFFTTALFLHNLRVRTDPEAQKHQGELAVVVEQLLHGTRAYLNGSSSETDATPAINLLASTYDWASRQRQQLELMSDQLEVALMQSHQLQSMAGICLVLGIASDPVPIDLAEVRSRAWLLSEAVVWAEVYRANLCGEGSADLENDVLLSIRIPQNTVTYLEKRFAADARKWITSPSSSSTLVPTTSNAQATVQRATAANSTPMSAVRRWAAKRLTAARQMLSQEPSLDAWNLTAEGRAEFRKTKVDSFAVAAFLLGMLNCYQQNAGFLLDQMTEVRKELLN